MKQLVSPKQVAAAKGKSAKWWREHKDEVGYYQPGERGIFFDVVDIEAYLERQKVPAKW